MHSPTKENTQEPKESTPPLDSITSLDDIPEHLRKGAYLLIKERKINKKKFLEQINDEIKYNDKKLDSAVAEAINMHSVKEKPAEVVKIKEESKKEIENQIKELKDPDLLLNIIEEVHKSGLRGEEDTIIITTIKQTIRFLKEAHPTSSNLIITGNPGMGKDETTKQVLQLLTNPKDLIHRTDLSEKALTYWGKTEDDIGKSWDWTGKVLYLEDPKEDTLKSAGIRTMSSGGQKATTVIDGKRVDLIFNGKPVMIVTSFDTSIDKHGDRRWDYHETDESKELTENIVTDTWSDFGGKTVDKINSNGHLRTALQTKLKRYDVVFPHFHLITKYLPTYGAMRTNVNKLMDYISASAILHQYQRKKNKQGRLIATWFDYDVGVYVYTKLEGIEGISLNIREQTLVDACKDGEVRTVTEIRELTQIPKNWFYDNMDGIVDRGIFKVTTKNVLTGTTKRDVTAYYIPEFSKYIPIPYSTIVYDSLTKVYNNNKIDSNDSLENLGKWEGIINKINEKRKNDNLFPISLTDRKFSKQSKQSICRVEKLSLNSMKPSWIKNSVNAQLFESFYNELFDKMEDNTEYSLIGLSKLLKHRVSKFEIEQRLKIGIEQGVCLGVKKKGDVYVKKYEFEI